MTRFFMTRGQRSTKQRNEYSPDFVSRGQKMNTRSHLSAFSCSSARAIRSAVETILIFIVRRPESISPQEAVEHAKEAVHRELGLIEPDEEFEESKGMASGEHEGF
jgi:hypothetical protein